MKKLVSLFLLLFLLTGLAVSLTACDDTESSFNMHLVDTNFVFNYAYVLFPGDTEVRKMEISAFYHYDSGNIQIQEKNTGCVYVFSSDCCVLAYEP